MRILPTLLLTISLGLIFCYTKAGAQVASDTIKRLVVDDYPVTNEMFLEQAPGNLNLKKTSGQTISFDQAWFSNDSLHQTLVFTLATDYHRMITYHFYNNYTPTEIIIGMEFSTTDGELASEKQSLQDFGGFLNQSTTISAFYFISDKGFQLGDAKQKALHVYGNPDTTTMTNGIEKLKWEFIGDAFYEGKPDLQGKPLAKESFGYHVTMYFREGRLIGQILFNDIP